MFPFYEYYGHANTLPTRTTTLVCRTFAALRLYFVWSRKPCYWDHNKYWCIQIWASCMHVVQEGTARAYILCLWRKPNSSSVSIQIGFCGPGRGQPALEGKEGWLAFIILCHWEPGGKWCILSAHRYAPRPCMVCQTCWSSVAITMMPCAHHSGQRY